MGQCLASSRAETSKKKKEKEKEKNVARIRVQQAQIGAKMRFSSIFFLTLIKDERSY